MKRYLSSLIAVALIMSAFVVLPASASVLCGETDYSWLPEWQGTYATPQGEWEMSPFGQMGYTISHGSSFGTTNTRFSTAPGVVTVFQVATMDGATYRTSLGIPICEPIGDIFGANADLYIHEIDVKFTGIERKISEGNSIEFYFGGAGWPGALQLKVFADGFMNGKNGTSAKFEIDPDGDTMTLIAAVDFRSQRTNFYVKRGEELTLVLGNQGFAYNNTGTYPITELSSMYLQVHGTMNAGARVDIYGARIYTAASAPYAEFSAEQISGEIEPESALTVNYDYMDELSEKETEINWYTYTDEYGNGEKLVHSSTYSKGDDISKKQYVLTDEDLTGGKFIKATILPKSSAQHPDYKTGEMVETDLKSLYYEMGNFKFYRESVLGKEQVSEENPVLSSDKLSVTYTSYYPESDLDFTWYAEEDEIGEGKEILLDDSLEDKKITCKISLKDGVIPVDNTEWIAEVPGVVDFDSKPEITNIQYKNRNGEVICEADNYVTLYASYDYNDDGITEGNSDDIKWYQSETGEEDSFTAVSGETKITFSPVEYHGKYLRYSVEANPLKGSKNGDIKYSAPIFIEKTTLVPMENAEFVSETPDRINNGSSVNVKDFVRITPENADNIAYSFICGEPSDSGKARFNEDGVLNAEKDGVVTVKVKIVCDLDAVNVEKTITKTFEITKLIDSLGFSIADKQTLAVGGKLTVGKNQIMINGNPESQFDADVNYEWKSSNTVVADVTSDGVITAKSAGTAIVTLTAKYNGSEKSADIEITVAAGSSRPSGGNFGGGGGGGGYKSSSSASSAPTVSNTPAVSIVETKFSDVPSDSWFAKPVSVLSEKGILNGRSESKFFPEETVTRAELAKIIALAFNLPEAESYRPHNDVYSGKWYYGYIASISNAGIMVGSDNNFRPDENLSREEIAVVLNNVIEKGFANAKTEEASKNFTDNGDISDWAKIAVKNISALKIVNGNEFDMFEPQRFCTRAEVAKMVYELMNLNGGV